VILIAKSRSGLIRDLQASYSKLKSELDDFEHLSQSRDYASRRNREDHPRSGEKNVYKDKIQSLREALHSLRSEMDSKERATSGSGIGAETAKFHMPTLESRGTQKFGSGRIEDIDNGRTVKRDPRLEIETFETFHSPILKNKDIEASEKLRIQSEQKEREQFLSPKIYKSPKQKDQIERSIKSQEYQSGPRSMYRSSDSFRASSARGMRTDESMKRIQERLDDLERELDEKLGNKEYVTNKDLFRGTANVAMTSDSKYQPMDTEEDDRYGRSSTTTYKKPIYVKPFEDPRKEQFKNAFDKHEKRILREEYQVEKSRSGQSPSEDEDQEYQLSEPKYKPSRSKDHKPKKKSTTQLFFETQIARLK